MKLLLVMLVFAVFTGSWAYPMEEDWDSKQAQLSEQLHKLQSYHTEEVNEKLDLDSHQLQDRIHNSYLQVAKRLRSLQDKLPTKVKEAFDRVAGVSWSVAEKALLTLHAWKKKVNSAAQKVSDKLSSILATYVNTVLEKLRQYTDTLQRTLDTVKTEGPNPELNEELNQQLEDLKAQLNPFVQEILVKLEEIEDNLKFPFQDFLPVSDQAKKFQHGMEKAGRRLQSFLAPILNTLQKYIKDIKEWFGITSVS